VARQAARGVAETLTVRAPTSLCRTNPSASFVEHEMDGAGSLVHELPRWLSCQRSGGGDAGSGFLGVMKSDGWYPRRGSARGGLPTFANLVANG
jgi:hypothetical protein